MKKHSNRDPFWSIVKGLGILFVVIGHTSGPMTRFVYLFHISLFFFLPGFFLYHKKQIDLRESVVSKIKTLWWPYVKYGVSFVLLHNLFYNFHLFGIPGETADAFAYTPAQMAMAIKDVLLFNQPELLLGPSWFIVVLFFSSLIFTFAVGVSNRWISHASLRTAFQFTLFILMGAIGAYFCSKGRIFRWRMELVFLIMPILFGGYMLSRYWSRVKSWIGLSALLLSGLALLFMSEGLKIDMDIAAQRFDSPLWVYTGAFLGVVFTLSAASLLQLSPFASSLFYLLGENSLHIMMLHFLAFKGVSLISVSVFNQPIERLFAFPVLDSSFWPLYTVMGIFIPVSLIYVYAWVTLKIRKT